MRRAIILAVIVILSNGCKKSHSDPPVVPIPALPPATTSVGTPVGNPVTKNIGAGGGTVLSADGRVELSFPANALATNTDITIQPVTNTAPGGAGLSYHLMPDGTKFNVPVSLTFHYTAADANGTLPFLFYIASRDNTGIWQADFKNRTVDTITKTASLPISHFSFWSLGSQVYLLAAPAQVSENDKSDLFVTIINDQGDPAPGAGGEFSLSALPSEIPVPISNITNWTVNGKPGGSAQDGTLSGTDSKETFTAPAKIDKQRTVQASGTLTYALKGWNNRKQVLQTNKYILFTDIVLQPKKLSFAVDVVLTFNGSSGTYKDVYTDKASFQVDLDKGAVTVSHFSNQAPSVTPPSGSYALTQADWINDGTGLVNITQGLGIITPPDTLFIFLAHTGTVSPKWKFTNLSDGSTYTTGGDPDIGYPSGITIIARDSAQKGSYTNGVNLSATWDITPLH